MKDFDDDGIRPTGNLTGSIFGLAFSVCVVIVAVCALFPNW